MKQYLISTVALALFGSFAQSLQAGEPVYSLDNLTQHPYRHVPSYGHASRNPGSPKFFRPGYGYIIPGYGSSNAGMFSLPGYSDHYEFGRRVPASYGDSSHQFWSDSYGGPWYHAGWTANTLSRWPGNRLRSPHR